MTNHIFRFSVAGIDSLLSPDFMAYKVNDGTFVGCIAGPDGVGKSIIGLHAASSYASANALLNPIVVYASTDLSHEQATESWSAFALDVPIHRRKSIREQLDRFSVEKQSLFDELLKRDASMMDRCELRWVSPHLKVPSSEPALHTFKDVFEGKRQNEDSALVHLLDLARFSAGDDWGLINRMLGLFADVRQAKACSVPYLLVVDAIEGLEAMVGDRDAFGLKRSRRSRLAQLVRVAKKVKCNLLFIIEQREDHVHLDEVFIADFVIRLRAVENYGYQRKTIEVEKARGVSHTRGQHEFQIRKGTGCEGGDDCADEPVMLVDKDGKPQTTAYLQVLPSLDVRPSVMPQLSLSMNQDRTFPRRWFGIEAIDQWFRLSEQSGSLYALGDRQRVCVVVGESGTYKSRLGLAFAAQAFVDLGVNKLRRKSKAGVVLISTEGIKSSHVHTAIDEWLQKQGLQLLSDTEKDEQVTVRSISPRYLSSAGFMFRVRACIRKMKKQLDIKNANEAGDIRFVIDNWTTLLDGHPALKDDPRLLQSLLALLRDEGITSCIIATQPGSPSATAQVDRIHDLAGLEVARVHVWPVDFFGSPRTALTASVAAGLSEMPSIYELKTEAGSKFRLEADRHFALYDDVDKGTPKRIDLKIKLYSGFHKDVERLSSANLYTRQVASLFCDLFPSSGAESDVVQFSPVESYNELKEHVQSLQQTQLRHTHVFQIDEFWNSHTSVGLADLKSYWEATTAVRSATGWVQTPDDVNGEYGPITRDRAKVKTQEFKRKQAYRKTLQNEEARICGIPLHKDFGFLLADHDAWSKFKDIVLLKAPTHGVSPKFVITPRFSDSDKRKLGVDGSLFPWRYDDSKRDTTPGDASIRVGHVWNALCMQNRQFFMDENIILYPTWELFFMACQAVASNVRRPSFDIDLRTTETFASLVLEIWMSNVRSTQKTLQSAGTTKASETLKKISEYLWQPKSQLGLSDWVLATGEYLYEAIRLLKGQMLFLGKSDEQFQPRTPDLGCVALRTWFAPAVLCQNEKPGLTPLALPGSYSVRGDWYLAVASGSRSSVLAQQAIDKLCSREMNIRRMQEGVGLPVRKMDDIGVISTALTAPSASTRDVRKVRYEELVTIEPSLDVESKVDFAKLQSRSNLPCGLRPFLRSNIKNYGRDNREFLDLIKALFDGATVREPKRMQHNPSASKSLFQPRSPGDLQDVLLDAQSPAVAGQKAGSSEEYLRAAQLMRSFCVRTSMG